MAIVVPLTGLPIPTVATPLFPVTSRYYRLDIGQLTAPDGRTLIYLRRRFVPSANRFTTLEEHVVIEGERLDIITAQHLGDPEQFWRVCDANNAMRPDDLISKPGRRLRITLPEGIVGAQ